jgi:hypothetical protein
MYNTELKIARLEFLTMVLMRLKSSGTLCCVDFFQSNRVPPCAASCSPKKGSCAGRYGYIGLWHLVQFDKGCTQCLVLPFLLAHNPDHPYIHNICIFSSVATPLGLIDPENGGSMLVRADN